MCSVCQNNSPSVKMARNHKFFFDKDGNPKARGPVAEKMLMAFLETDVQGSDHICRDLMDDLTAIEDESDDSREFIGNAHQVLISPDGVTLTQIASGDADDPAQPVPISYKLAFKHFREVLEDWEAFIMDDQLDDPRSEDDY